MVWFDAWSSGAFLRMAAALRDGIVLPGDRLSSAFNRSEPGRLFRTQPDRCRASSRFEDAVHDFGPGVGLRALGRDQAERREQQEVRLFGKRSDRRGFLGQFVDIEPRGQVLDCAEGRDRVAALTASARASRRSPKRSEGGTFSGVCPAAQIVGQNCQRRPAGS